MKALRNGVFLVLVGIISACVGGADGAPDAGSRPAVASQVSEGGVVSEPLAVVDVQVTVPADLRVSEANLFYPLADIVWRGDPRGDRHMQVKSVMEEGLRRGTAAMKTGRPVILQVNVTRFHSLTEKTRYTVGGVHSVKFDMMLVDAKTGQVLDGPRRVNADVKAAGGDRAVAEDQAGRTMRVVIVEHLAQVITQALPRADQAGSVSR